MTKWRIDKFIKQEKDTKTKIAFFKCISHDHLHRIRVHSEQ